MPILVSHSEKGMKILRGRVTSVLLCFLGSSGCVKAIIVLEAFQYTLWLSIKFIDFWFWNFHLTEVEISGLFCNLFSRAIRKLSYLHSKDLPFSQHRHHLFCSVLKCLNSKSVVRFVIHCLIEIIQIHCHSAKWCELFGRENNHSFCPFWRRKVQVFHKALLENLRCSHSCFGFNQLLKACKMGKLWSSTKCCCH